MKSFSQLTMNEQAQCIEKGKVWFVKHEDHVVRLLERNENGIWPSGSDCFHPELWKGIHWQWFMNRIKESERNLDNE